MGSTGKLEVDVELKSKPEKFWHGIRESTTLFPKAMPEEYKRIDVVEGDGFSVGSVRLVHYGEGSPLVKVTHEKIEAVDKAKMTYAYSVIDGDLLKFYKNFKAFLVVEPKGDGSLVKWACEFEKASDEIPDPNIIRDFAVKSFKDLDSYLNA